jgi:hypothetical protein
MNNKKAIKAAPNPERGLSSFSIKQVLILL